jgi:transcriptional regulator with XRE-family HTH domain
MLQMEILDRIKMVMKMNQLNAASFADRIGVQRSNVSHVLTGRNKPSLDFIEKMLIQFPKVNASWLISGQIQQTDVITSVKENENLITNVNQNKNTNVNREIASKLSDKRIVKMITFYEDFTFDEFRPSND